jgi:protein-L-isoaspartate(D-aspartate) O-methyltransferase
MKRATTLLILPLLFFNRVDFEMERERMVKTQIEARGIKDERVLDAMRKVPRERFVPKRYHTKAYGDHPLPIGFGQTISQPYIVALMSEALKLQKGERALEIGTGSGYQAAVLAQMGAEVYSIEIIKELYERAKEVLSSQGYEVKLLHGDGYYGWPEYAPYDAIIVTCAPDHIPPPLLKQLREGGIMVAPIGPPGAYQTLWRVEKREEGFKLENLGGVRFVPLVRRSQ